MFLCFSLNYSSFFIFSIKDVITGLWTTQGWIEQIFFCSHLFVCLLRGSQTHLFVSWFRIFTDKDTFYRFTKKWHLILSHWSQSKSLWCWVEVRKENNCFWNKLRNSRSSCSARALFDFVKISMINKDNKFWWLRSLLHLEPNTNYCKISECVVLLEVYIQCRFNICIHCLQKKRLAARRIIKSYN